MKKLLFVAAAALVVLHADLRAQQATCGMSTSDQTPNVARLQANLAAADAAGATDRGVVTYVPIYFHLVANASGSGRMNPYQVLRTLCALNDFYAPHDIQFYLRPHATYGMFDESISNDNVYENQSNVLVMNLRKNTQAINCYVANNAVSGNQTQPGVIIAGYYTPAYDWVVFNKSYFNGSVSNSTVPHEVGHWLSLNHTFYGWEGETFEAGDAGWPCAPVTSPGGVPTERQNGTNCTTGGDMICDTPPDYGFLQGCSPYTGGAKDPLCTTINPMENNCMGYFENCSGYIFTAMQAAAMHADIQSPARNFLDNNFAPAALTVSSPTDLLKSPINGVVTDYYNSVPLEWRAVTGATHYLLQTDIVPTFGSSMEEHYVVTDTQFTVTNLDPNKTYHWRVTPFNQYATCDLGIKGSFKTGTVSVATHEATNIDSWSVSPNPAGAGAESVAVLVRAGEAFTGQLTVFNAAGQRVLAQRSVNFTAGQNAIDLPTTGWSNGLYYIALENETGRSVRKLVVLR